MASYQLSVCAEMVFLDLPFVERVKRIHALGFGVEIWGWANKDIDALAADTLALVEAVNSPALKMNLDLYHAQIGEGNLIELIRRCGSAIGEIQVADVPGRQQPGTGEINYRAIARALHDVGYQGTVALEGWASGESGAALQQFRDHFTL